MPLFPSLIHRHSARLTGTRAEPPRPAPLHSLPAPISNPKPFPPPCSRLPELLAPSTPSTPSKGSSASPILPLSTPPHPGSRGPEAEGAEASFSGGGGDLQAKGDRRRSIRSAGEKMGGMERRKERREKERGKRRGRSWQ